MEIIHLDKKVLIIIETILLVVLCIGFVNAASYPIPKQLPFDPNKINVSDIKPDDGVEYQNFTTYIIYWNERMKWGFSEKQINELSLKIENHSMSSLARNGDFFHVSNLTKYDEDISVILNLSKIQTLKFIETDRKQLEIDHQNYEKFPQDFGNINFPNISSRNRDSISYIAPSSQSAPYALGKLYYLFIFIDFSNPSVNGTWATHHNDEIAAQYNATYGTQMIRLLAPPGTIDSSDYSFYEVLVTGENIGGGEQTWGKNGWMEQAAKNLGFTTDSNQDGRTTDEMVRWVKTLYNQDTVIIVWCTHDKMGGYTVHIEGSYADWVVLSHWGAKSDGGYFNSEAGSYEHEVLHQYGALDESQNSPSYCGQKSLGSVSPMSEMYGNTNFWNCSGSTQSVMKDPYYYNGDNPLWYIISDSTRKFIGWGDYDSDGILDPLDARPWGVRTKIGVFRNSTHFYYEDYNGNGVWDGALIDRAYDFGIVGDIPVSGDWNNDGRDEIGVFRPSTHMYYQDYNGNGTWNGAVIDRVYNFGITGDIPVSGDWNGDGRDEIGVYRPSTLLYYRDYNGNGLWEGSVIDRVSSFGITGDIPVSGDWNNNGITEIGTYRPSTFQFYLDYNGNGVWNGAGIDRQYNFSGITGDLPVSGDWTGDGKTEIGVFRPSTHIYYQDYNGNGIWDGAIIDRAYNFGITGDSPVSGIWN